MYFDPIPKESLKDFFNYREELKNLEESTKQLPLTVVKGVRRVGKTSLLKVFYNSTKNPKIWIDARAVKERNIFELVSEYIEIESRVLKDLDLKEVGINSVLSLRLEKREKMLLEIDKSLKKKIYIFIDEAQIFNREEIAKFLSYAYDNLRNMKFIIAGSQIGLLEKIIGKGESSPPYLKGRLIGEVEMRRLDNNRALSFLLEGFSQEGKERSLEDLKDAVNKLGGLMGWLTYYGFYSRNHSHKEALEKVRSSAFEICKEELLSFLSETKMKRKRVIETLKILKKPSRWEEILDELSFKEGKRISTSSLKRVLDKLKDYSFIEKKENKYVVVDKVFADFISKL